MVAGTHGALGSSASVCFACCSGLEQGPLFFAVSFAAHKGRTTKIVLPATICCGVPFASAGLYLTPLKFNKRWAKRAEETSGAGGCLYTRWGVRALGYVYI